MRIALSADHAGYKFKDVLAAWLREAGPNHTTEMMDELTGALVEIWDRLALELGRAALRSDASAFLK